MICRIKNEAERGAFFETFGPNFIFIRFPHILSLMVHNHRPCPTVEPKSFQVLPPYMVRYSPGMLHRVPLEHMMEVDVAVRFAAK